MGFTREGSRYTLVTAVADRRFFTHSVMLMGASLIMVKVASYGQSMFWLVRYFSLFFTLFCFARVAINVARPVILKALFLRQPWATAPNANVTMAWELSVGLLLPKKGVAGKAPLFSYCLPELPLPSLDDTLSRHVSSLSALLPPDRFLKVEAAAKALAGDRGGALQRALRRGQSGDEGWLAPWLQRRFSVQASNHGGRFYLLDSMVLPGEGAGLDQATRAACLASKILDFAQMLRAGKISPKGYPQRFTLQPKVVPRCLGAFQALFTASMVPRDEGYEIKWRHWRECREHVVVFRRGSAFQVGIRDGEGGRIGDLELMRRLKVVVAVAAKVSKNGKGFERVSRLQRAEAAKARLAMIALIGSAKETLALLETAALIISLDGGTSRGRSEQASSTVMGDAGSPGGGGGGRWFERGFTLVVGQDCKASLACVEPLAELATACQMWEHALAAETYPLTGAGAHEGLFAPAVMQWNDDKINAECEAAHQSFLRELQSTEVRVVDMSAFCRSKLKFPIPPHAFLQLAAQVAYGRAHGEACFSQTWVSTRIFREGRSEAARTMTRESLALVKAMGTASMDTFSQQRSALLDAVASFERLVMDAMLGKGVTSHLRALREAACVAGGGEAGLLDDLMGPEVRLETCVVPVQVNAGTSKDKVSVGGGFQPSSKDGYAVSFALVGDDNLFVHVVGARATSSTNVDVNEFLRHLLGTLRDMHHVASSVKSRKRGAAGDD